MKRAACFGLIVSFALLLFGCGKSKEQAAQELERLNLKVQIEDFVRSAERGDIKALLLFFDAGIDVNAKNSAGYTALMAAAKSGQVDVANKLLAQKVSLDVQGYKGFTALTLAAENNQLAIVEALLAKNADPNLQDNNGWSALMKAVYRGNTDCVVAIADRSRQEVNRGLLIAALMGHKETAQALLDRGAEIDSRAEDGRTPLMLAASTGNKDMVEFLLRAGADPALADNSGATAGSLASSKGKGEVAALLKNAPPRSGDNAATTPNPPARSSATPSAATPDREFLAQSAGTAAESVPDSGRADAPPSSGSQAADQLPVAKNIRIVAIQQEFLPAVLREISGKKATIETAGGDSYSVAVGDQLKDLDYKVTDIEIRSTEDKDGNPVDNSVIKLRNTKTGQVVTLIKGIPARERPSYALLAVSGSSEPVKVETDQKFSIPTDPDHTYEVLDIRPAQVIIKRVEDNRVVTLQKK
jgi:ankyrin repeat protein